MGLPAASGSHRLGEGAFKQNAQQKAPFVFRRLAAQQLRSRPRSARRRKRARTEPRVDCVHRHLKVRHVGQEAELEARAAALRRGVNAGLRRADTHNICADVPVFVHSAICRPSISHCRAAEADALEAAAAAFRGSAEKAKGWDPDVGNVATRRYLMQRHRRFACTMATRSRRKGMKMGMMSPMRRSRKAERWR